MNAMLRIVAAMIVFGLAMIGGSANAWAKDTAATRESPTIPPYNEWICGRQDDKSRGIGQRMCRFDYQSEVVIPETYDTIIEYTKIESTDPALLIWIRVALDGESVRMYFYERGEGEWRLVEEKVFVRNRSPIDKDIPFFALDSQFGKEYQKLLCQFYEPECRVFVPIFRFPPR